MTGPVDGRTDTKEPEGATMNDQGKRDAAPPTGTAAAVAQLVAEHFNGRPNDNAHIQSTWDGHAGTLTVVVTPTSPAIELPIAYGGGEPWTSVSRDHVVHAVIDATQSTAPENVFMPTENPDGTMTTKVPAGHPAAGGITGRMFDRALSPEEVAARSDALLKDEHPAPWRWVLDRRPSEVDDQEHSLDEQRAPLMLFDAADEQVIDTDGADYAWVVVTSPLARELIRLAPEMEQALRYFVGLMGDVRPAHPECAKAIRVLAALDAARKATP